MLGFTCFVEHLVELVTWKYSGYKIKIKVFSISNGFHYPNNYIIIMHHLIKRAQVQFTTLVCLTGWQVKHHSKPINLIAACSRIWFSSTSAGTDERSLGDEGNMKAVRLRDVNWLSVVQGELLHPGCCWQAWHWD